MTFGRKQDYISVTCVAVTVSTVMITIAAAVILSVTLTYSLEAADEFAESYSQNSISAAQNKVNDFVKIPLNAFAELRNAADLGHIPDIVTTVGDADRRVAFQQWHGRQQPMMFSSEFTLLYIGMGFEDETWIDCAIMDKYTMEHDCTFSNPTNTTLSAGENYLEIYKFVGRQFISMSTDNYEYLPTTRSWYIEAPKTRDASPIFSLVYFDFELGIPVVDVNGPLYSKAGTFVGVTSITLDLRQIASFLSEMPRTSRGFSALVDGEGFMLGASDMGTLFHKSPYNSASDGPLENGCEELSDTSEKACRLTPSTYSNDALRSLSSKESGIFANDGSSFTRKIQLGGEQWTVSKAPIAAKTDVTEATISWQIFTLMPVKDVTSSILKGRDVGIIVAAIIITFSCAVCAIILFMVLKPLGNLALHMEQAAALKDDSLGATMDKSSMREIRAIQDSFERLSAQLKKAKSFLPASLLAQLESSDDSCLSDEEDFVDESKKVHSPLSTPIASSHSPKNAVRRTNSNRTTQSSTTAGMPTGGTFTRTISSSVVLVSRNVTIAALNLRNFHRNALEHPSGLEASYGKLVDEYQRIAKEHRGIMDSFHGDRFTFTFNTVRPCAAHASMAATAMLKIVASMEHHAPGSTSVMSSAVTCGVATGRCLVGNLGSDKAKRYTVIGPAFSHATVLERLCKRYPNTSVLLSAETSKDCETHIGLLYMDVIDGPGRKAVPIAAAKYLKESANSKSVAGEWMYEMALQNSTCGYQDGNKAFLSALTGDVNTAKVNLEAFKDTTEECEFVKTRILDLIKGGLSSELGLFFDRCILDVSSESADKNVWKTKKGNSDIDDILYS